MRTSSTYVKQISWSAEGAETTKIRTRTNVANAAAARKLIGSRWKSGSEVPKSEWGNPIFRGVPKADIATFLDGFEVHPHNFALYIPEDERQTYGLAQFLRSTDEPKLQHWDVVIPQGSLVEMDFLGIGLSLKPLRRNVTTPDDGRTILVSGSKARVGSRGVEREGVPKEEVDRLIDEAKPNNVSDKVFRVVRSRPLLLLYPVMPFLEGAAWTGLVEGDLLVAYGLSFPAFDDSGLAKKVPYRVNKTWLRDHAIDDDFDEDEADDDAS